MPSFGGAELERGIDLQRRAELVPALPLAARDAMNEGEVLVGLDLIGGGQARVEAPLQELRRLGVIAALGLFDARGEILPGPALEHPHDSPARARPPSP